MKKVVKIDFEMEGGDTFSFEGEEANAFATAVAKLWTREKERRAEANEAFEHLLSVMKDEEKKDKQSE